MNTTDVSERASTPSASRRARNQRGQALPLAAIGIFAMALAVLATLNLGQAVHQKIKLQNTADSAAYTLAAMEARTFNYIAFLNRTQIAHYNTAMAVQSYMSYVGYQVSLFSMGVDLLEALKGAYETGLSSESCPYCPYKAASAVSYAPLVIALETATAAREAAKAAYKAGEEIGHKIVEAMGIFNARQVWQTQLARAVLLNAHILTGMQGYIEKLDPDISFKSGKSSLLNWLVNSALNSIEYYQTFDRAAGLNPFIFSAVADFPQLAARDYHIKADGMGSSVGGTAGKLGAAGNKVMGDADVDEAYRVMASLCNASRSPSFVSDRGMTVDSGFRNVANISIWGNKMGQTKMTENGTMIGASIPDIRNVSRDPKGGYVSSDDYIIAAQGGGLALPAMLTWTGTLPLGDAIAAYEDKGKHYMHSGTDGTPSGTTITIPPSPKAMLGGRFKSQSDHAPWKGFAAYFKFKPSSDRTADFNQPSTWIFLNKSHEDFQTEAGAGATETRAPWYQKFSWQHGSQVAELDTTVGGSRNSYLFEGINAVARGMAYYHRPGNWAEHPNFFNPYWRARLAPVGQKLQAFWERYVSSSITTSSDSAAVKAAVNVLRNAQMDLFTAAITSLITH